MRLTKSLYLPIAMVALLGGCKSDSTSKSTAPTPLPPASASTTITSGTSPVTFTLSPSTTVNIPAASAATILSSYGAGAKVEVSQNDPTKYPPNTLVVTGAAALGSAVNAVYVISIKPAGAGSAETSAANGSTDAGAVQATTPDIFIDFVYTPPTGTLPLENGTFPGWGTDDNGVNWVQNGSLTVSDYTGAITQGSVQGAAVNRSALRAQIRAKIAAQIARFSGSAH